MSISCLFQVVTFSFMISFCFLSCSQKTVISIIPSHSEKPSWIVRLPERKGDLHYFTGVSTSNDSLEEGQKAAYKNALAEISNFTGIQIKSFYQSSINNTERTIIGSNRFNSSSKIYGAKIVDTYFEKIQRIDKKYRLEKYDFYVLVQFSAKEAEKEINRQKQQKTNRVKNAYTIFLKGRKYENCDELSEAVKFYNKAFSMIEGINQNIEIRNSTIDNSDALKLSLITSIDLINAKLRQVNFSFNFHQPNFDTAQFLNNFMSSIAQKGFILSSNPAIKISGDVTVSQGGYVLNNHVYWASGTVSAKNVKSGKTIAFFTYKEKGFHKTKTDSANEALAAAGINAGEKFTELINGFLSK